MGLPLKTHPSRLYRGQTFRLSALWAGCSSFYGSRWIYACEWFWMHAWVRVPSKKWGKIEESLRWCHGLQFIKAEWLREQKMSPKSLVLGDFAPLVSLTSVQFSSVEIFCHLYQWEAADFLKISSSKTAKYMDKLSWQLQKASQKAAECFLLNILILRGLSQQPTSITLQCYFLAANHQQGMGWEGRDMEVRTKGTCSCLLTNTACCCPAETALVSSYPASHYCVVESMTMSLTWVYIVMVDWNTGDEFIFTYWKDVLFFPSNPSFLFLSMSCNKPAMLIGNISCLPPAVNHHLSNTATDADSSAWLFGEDAVLGDRKLISTWRDVKALLKGWWRTILGICSSVL